MAYTNEDLKRDQHQLAMLEQEMNRIDAQNQAVQQALDKLNYKLPDQIPEAVRQELDAVKRRVEAGKNEDHKPVRQGLTRSLRRGQLV